MESKVCSICNLEKDICEFTIYNKTKGKTRGYCKVCEKLKKKDEYKRNFKTYQKSKIDYAEKNLELIKTYKDNYYQENKEIISEKGKQYRLDNKEVIIERKKVYYNDNIETIKEDNRIYYQENKEDIKKRVREYRNNNLEVVRQREMNYQRNKRQSDPFYRLTENVRTRVRNSFKTGYSKNSKTQDILGCSFNDFKEHIEAQFADWMNWDNYGNPKDGIYELNKTWDLDHIIPIATTITEEDVIRLNHYTNYQPLCSYTNRFIKRDL